MLVTTPTHPHLRWLPAVAFAIATLVTAACGTGDEDVIRLGADRPGPDLDALQNDLADAELAEDLAGHDLHGRDRRQQHLHHPARLLLHGGREDLLAGGEHGDQQQDHERGG